MASLSRIFILENHFLKLKFRKEIDVDDSITHCNILQLIIYQNIVYRVLSSKSFIIFEYSKNILISREV